MCSHGMGEMTVALHGPPGLPGHTLWTEGWWTGFLERAALSFLLTVWSGQGAADPQGLGSLNHPDEPSNGITRD